VNKERPVWFRYTVAFLAVASASIVRAIISPLVGEAGTFLTYYPAIIIASLYGGLGPGLLAIVLSCFAAAFRMEMIGRPVITSHSVVVGMALFLVGNLLIVWICEQMRRANRLAAAQARKAEACAANLRQSEERCLAHSRELEILLETIPAPVWIAHDRECLHITRNRAAREILGLKSEHDLFNTDPETELNDCEVRIQGQAISRNQLPLERAAATGKPVEGKEIEIRRADGDVRWIYGGAIPLFDEQGAVRGCLSTFVEITERKRAEEALVKAMDILEDRVAQRTAELSISEQRLSLAQRAGHVGVFDWDIVTGTVIRSERMEEIFGVSTGSMEPTYEGWAQRVHPDDFPGMDAFFKEWIQSEQSEKNFEYRFYRPDGQVRWLSGRARIIRDASGKALRMIGTSLDITENKHAEETLQQAKFAAEQANRAKDQFLAVLSHELRTPLMPVLATVTGWDSQVDIPAEIRSDMEVIRRNMELEARLIDDLLDVTKIGRGKIDLHHAVLDIHACLRTVLEICQSEIEAKHLDVSLSLSADRHHVSGDPTRLQQVFWNILKNAVKFTPEKGRISLKTMNADGKLRIEISDTGVGITPDVLPRLFNAFEQGEQNRTRQFGGLGVGLSIAKSVVELHHGSLTASSKGSDKGATFTVDLDTVSAGQEPNTPLASLTTSEENQQRILLVDDHPDTLQTMAKLLRKWGYTVTTAMSVRGALEQASRESFDLIISDVGLPDGSGLDIMRQVKELYGLRGIALSGYGTDEDIRQSQAAGFEEHLVKPVCFEVLRLTVQRIGGANQAVPRS
jgi:PAS domain S-box-containing protein